MFSEKVEAPLQLIEDEITERAGVIFYIKREDLTHEHISGNKWRKLKYNLRRAKELNYSTLLTFGGAYSNHISATAYAAKKNGFNSIGIIRGEKYEDLNPTLSFAKENGMELHYISREDYRKKDSHDFIENLQKSFGPFYLIPEGGANEPGVKGCEEIVDDIEIKFDYICCACGTGTTMAGIIRKLKSQKAIGFSALKGGEFLESEIEKYTPKTENWTINTDYHFGGYAKTTTELTNFITNFEKVHHIHLEPIYTGKMIYGIYDLMQKGFFKKGETIIAIHTGGLQGNKGIRN